jgi:hypothetical protein
MMSEKDPHKETNDSFDKVFLDEMTKWVCKLPKYTNGAEEPGSPDHPDPRNKLVGLAMSGGRTRSATFNLGVTQALAHYGLMSQVDYMSTVSCGGYLGPRSHRSALTNSPLRRKEIRNTWEWTAPTFLTPIKIHFQRNPMRR